MSLFKCNYYFYFCNQMPQNITMTKYQTRISLSAIKSTQVKYSMWEVLMVWFVKLSSFLLTKPCVVLNANAWCRSLTAHEITESLMCPVGEVNSIHFTNTTNRHWTFACKYCNRNKTALCVSQSP